MRIFHKHIRAFQNNIRNGAVRRRKNISIGLSNNP